MKSYEGYSIRAVKKRYLGSPTNDGRLFLFVPPIMIAETMGTFHDLRREIKFVNYYCLLRFFVVIFVISFALIGNTSLKLLKYVLFIYYYILLLSFRDSL